LVRSNFPLASQSTPQTWRSRQLLLGFLHLTNTLGDKAATLLLMPELGSLAARLRDRNLETFANQHFTPDERHLEIILKVFTSFGVVVVEQCLDHAGEYPAGFFLLRFFFNYQFFDVLQN